MKRAVLLATLVLAGCGGVSSEDGFISEVSLLSIEPTSSTIVADVLSRKPETKAVNSGNNCGSVIQANDVCTYTEYNNSTVKFRFSLRPTIETPLPSPVAIRDYRVSYNNCTNDRIEGFVGMVVNPGETKETDIAIVLSTTKRNMVQETENYIYVARDGCQTPFTRPAFTRECYARARIDFNVVEILTGKSKTVPVYVGVVFKDEVDPNECRVRDQGGGQDGGGQNGGGQDGGGQEGGNP